MTDAQQLEKDLILPALKPFKRGAVLQIGDNPSRPLLVEVVVVRVDPLYDRDGQIARGCALSDV